MEILSTKKVKSQLDERYPTTYKKYGEEDYKKLNESIKAYKMGSAWAAEYIVSSFHKILRSYADFICDIKKGDEAYRHVDDKSLHKFVKLFIPKRKSLQASTRQEGAVLFGEACGKIRIMFSKFEYADIYNELVCTLLNMACKYKVLEPGDENYKENGTFHLYVAKCFHYDAYNALTKMIKDPLSHMETYSLIEENTDDEWECWGFGKTRTTRQGIIDHAKKRVLLKDETTDGKEAHMLTEAERDISLRNSETVVLKEKGIDPYEPEALNFNWTNGTVCSSDFLCLTSYERELLVLSFSQHKTDSEIAKLYGCHRITIVKHKKAAIEKMKEHMKRKKPG